MGIAGDWIGVAGDWMGVAGDWMGVAGDWMGVAGDFSLTAGGVLAIVSAQMPLASVYGQGIAGELCIVLGVADDTLLHKNPSRVSFHALKWGLQGHL
jgi:hypothetical protein